ncbi:MAG: hypothetical protein AAGA28_06640 [Pseudomonadota bacterium]
MHAFIWAGTALGFVIGVIHALAIARPAIGTSPEQTARIVWRAVVTLVLWTVFGAYLLIFWLLGAVVMGLSAKPGPGQS